MTHTATAPHAFDLQPELISVPAELSSDAAVALAPSELRPLEIEVIDIFVSLVKMLGIPKSVAEIYGLLFVSPKPMALDSIMQRLSISKGSVSQGLKLLRGLGAIKQIYVAGDRRDHYVAETELKKLAAGFIRGEVEPRLESAANRLTRLTAITSSLETAAEEQEFYRSRVGKLRQWQSRGAGLLPLISGMLGE